MAEEGRDGSEKIHYHFCFKSNMAKRSTMVWSSGAFFFFNPQLSGGGREGGRGKHRCERHTNWLPPAGLMGGGAGGNRSMTHY